MAKSLTDAATWWIIGLNPLFVSRRELHVLAGGLTLKSPSPLVWHVSYPPISILIHRMTARYGEICRNRRNRLRCKSCSPLWSLPLWWS